MELRTKIGRLELVHPVLNAAGTCKTLEDFKKLVRTPLPAVMVGSITTEVRYGNPGSTFFSNPNFSLNSVGLSNPGIDYYIEFLPQMVKIADAADKYVFVSVEGSRPAGYALLTELAFQSGVHLVELNLGCPNKWTNDGRQETIPSYDLDMLKEILRVCKLSFRFTRKNKILSVKLSPIPDPVLLKKIADLINESEIICAVTTSNTLPNAFAYADNDKPAIQSVTELGGMGGSALKPIALGQVKQLRELLRDGIDIIGVGGIKTGKDVLDYLNAGASAVQIGTACFDRGPQIFGDVLTELAAL